MISENHPIPLMFTKEEWIADYTPLGKDRQADSHISDQLVDRFWRLIIYSFPAALAQHKYFN